MNLTVRCTNIWSLMMIMDDNDGQMILGDLGGLKLPDICLTGKETPKKPHPGNLSRPGIEPGPNAWQARMLPPDQQRWTIRQSERTTTKDPVQHKRWTYPWYRAVNREHQQRWTRCWSWAAREVALSEVPVMQEKRKKGWRMSCDVGDHWRP